jgi:hypothetical protein
VARLSPSRSLSAIHRGERQLQRASTDERALDQVRHAVRHPLFDGETRRRRSRCLGGLDTGRSRLGDLQGRRQPRRHDEHGGGGQQRHGHASGVDWKLTISATEAQAAEINIQIVDAATKAVEDQFLTVYTYGNASAKFAGDWSDIVRLGLTGLANAVPGAAGGLLIAGTNTATTFAGVAAAGATPATAGLTVTGGAASTTGGGVAAAAIVVTGGAGAASTNGAASGATFAGGGTNTVASTADGIKATGTSTGHGLDAQSGAGATGNGINAVSNATNGSGATLTKAGSGNDLNATSTPLVLAKTTNITGFNDIAATAVVSAGAITTSGGAVTTVTNLTNLPTIPANWLTAAGTAADFGTELATAIWTDTTAGDFTVAASVGKSVMNGVALGTGSHGRRGIWRCRQRDRGCRLRHRQRRRKRRR